MFGITRTRTASKSLKNVAQSHPCNPLDISKSIKDKLRALLRETAQPVAVVTSFMPPNSSSTSHRFHGATLSSFTSIAMDPYPLIAFALRMPSRMASSLDAAQPDQTSHMVVNLLSAEQASISVKFSRPDLYPEPFSSIPYSLSEEGLPIIGDSLGAISCKLVSKAIPLHDLELLKGESSDEVMKPLLEDCPSSNLFIAHVTRVESSPSDNEDSLPLLYHRRQYTSCQIPPRSLAMDP